MIRFSFIICIIFSPLLVLSQTGNKYLVGRTTGELPFLEYGLGADRLGGAKMGLLDTSIVLKIVDSTVINYKVQLSTAHYAWINKANVRIDTLTRIPSYYLTNSWLVKGDSLYDYVSIGLDERLPYRVTQLLEPSRLQIDILGATSNTNWITQRSSAKEVKKAWYEQSEDDVFRVIIELNHDQHWGYSLYYEGKKLMVRIKRQPDTLDLSHLRIAIDAGHGGDNSGAAGTKTKILEKNYTLKIAKELEKELLLEGADVFMTRKKDTTLSMPERIDMLKAFAPDLLISIHLNSSAKDSVSGVSTYYRYIGFKPLTASILESMVALGLNEFGNVGAFNFSLSGPTEYPNCLVEVAFLSNKDDEQLILDPEFHKAVACQITEGIKKWLLATKRK
ncbi:MAG: N-acetylmuramoyl-L-alanine amidase [Chitinophagaceae bacterium]|nr:N-acetylmuramoyl-L-alanine amidase [Chitinophagaceae bacterium]